MDVIGFFVILLLIFANGFFVSAEFALVSIRPSRLEEMIRENRPLAVITKKAATMLNDMLSVCQVGITIASLLLGWVGEGYLSRWILPIFHYAGYSDVTAHGVAVAISFALITFLHILLGELLPKTVAIQKTETLALVTSVPIFFFYYLFFPITFFLNGMTSFLLKRIGFKEDSHRIIHSPEELMILIQEQNIQGNIDQEEFQIIKKTFEFSEHLAKDVMTHRLSIVGIPADTSMDGVLVVIAEHHFSRYPVYEGTTDNIVGIIHVQAFLAWLSESKRNKKSTKVTSIMQPPIVVPEGMSIEKILQKLRAAKQHMAIVVDEYGGVSGLLTMEDIVEEVFGEIRDETDDHETDAVPSHSPDAFDIDGETELDELKEILIGIQEEELNDIRTIAGFILDKLEDIPKEGTEVKIPEGILTVEKMDGNKIMTVRFTRLSRPSSFAI
ncbi:HlyC/CorC family transporter [Leptospira langatensis]|uniref:HlyC/CorC family transporter n=1 Tax=Leptospira langatensis TaxID=2484983 RepID=A0A5F1ZXN8_9LEPT|nr:hemolysin family protein [Leptospira langatensis]TGK03225.1 HlyC/CorC family transporter [Leptospira langatensis]TGL42401.1 HlyC/CorC family transporter [Leptospira langatensis]